MPSESPWPHTNTIAPGVDTFGHGRPKIEFQRIKAEPTQSIPAAFGEFWPRQPAAKPARPDAAQRSVEKASAHFALPTPKSKRAPIPRTFDAIRPAKRPARCDPVPVHSTRTIDWLSVGRRHGRHGLASRSPKASARQSIMPPKKASTANADASIPRGHPHMPQPRRPDRKKPRRWIGGSGAGGRKTELACSLPKQPTRRRTTRPPRLRSKCRRGKRLRVRMDANSE
ncbi:hypothetical protein Pla100_10350 [Neorhodopirellula pilleata]|uniref:Uncharacterized protein n=1 Tax=Neorhodopirellula pilleata TaxID=2714738 RepID=A0A5C6AY74_9BACT|nr:hypothetical protein Pla100_10350 [Neorhodopirellula pilleata]